MNFANLLSTYITLNIVIVAVFAGLVAFRMLYRYFDLSLSHRAELSLHYFSLSAVAFTSVLFQLLPKKEIFQPVAKIWVASSTESFPQDYSSPSQGFLSMPGIQMFEVNSTSQAILFLALAVLVIGGAKLGLDIWRLLRLRSRSFLIRQIHSVNIYINQDTHVPFSFWLPGRNNVVLPASLLSQPGFRIALLHELQHHRQRDTRWVYLMWFLRLAFFLNPIIHVWNRWLCEVQEFACDEALVGQHKVDSRAYASCLIQVAETALGFERQPICAVGLMFNTERTTLKRRIRTMLNEKKSKHGWKAALPIGAAVVAILSATAYASKGLVQDRRISHTQAVEMAKSVQGDFPIVINDQVLKWLNYYVGTPEGREQVAAALTRMQSYRSVIEGKLEGYQLPRELMAVPLIESGFRNLDGKDNTVSGAAGLWQFVEQTARNYGLRVFGGVDERLDVDLSTDAALRLLLVNKLRFKDWQLSVISYNAGEGLVQKAINRRAHETHGLS